MVFIRLDFCERVLLRPTYGLLRTTVYGTWATLIPAIGRNMNCPRNRLAHKQITSVQYIVVVQVELFAIFKLNSPLGSGIASPLVRHTQLHHADKLPFRNGLLRQTLILEASQ